MNIVILIILSYFVGSIPVGWILTKFTTGRLYDKDRARKLGPIKQFLIKFRNGHDIRHYGSKNPGATNVWRVLGPLYGTTVGLIDIAKAFVLVYFLVPWLFGLDSIYLVVAGISCIFGNTFTIWFQNLKGGKAVATSAGVFLALMPLPFIFALLVWLLVLRRKGYVSLASMSAAVSLLAAYLIYLAFYGLPVFGATDWPKTIFATMLVVLILFNHRSNIKRLLKGEENSMKSNKAH